MEPPIFVTQFVTRESRNQPKVPTLQSTRSPLTRTKKLITVWLPRPCLITQVSRKRRQTCPRTLLPPLELLGARFRSTSLRHHQPPYLTLVDSIETLSFPSPAASLSLSINFTASLHRNIRLNHWSTCSCPIPLSPPPDSQCLLYPTPDSERPQQDPYVIMADGIAPAVDKGKDTNAVPW